MKDSLRQVTTICAKLGDCKLFSLSFLINYCAALSLRATFSDNLLILLIIRQQALMATLRQFSLFDMLHYNNINLDILTETFNSYFYAKYLIKWPEYCVSLWSSTQMIQAYLIGKIEGIEAKKEWHGHVTAVTVAPECRKQGLAKLLMNYLQRVTEAQKGFFVDLFVRSCNAVAIEMYKKLGYDIYRTVNKYYSSSIDHSGQDAYDMRKSLSRDPNKQTSKPTGKRIQPNELEWN